MALPQTPLWDATSLTGDSDAQRGTLVTVDGQDWWGIRPQGGGDPTPFIPAASPPPSVECAPWTPSWDNDPYNEDWIAFEAPQPTLLILEPPEFSEHDNRSVGVRSAPSRTRMVSGCFDEGDNFASEAHARKVVGQLFEIEVGEVGGTWHLPLRR